MGLDYATTHTSISEAPDRPCRDIVECSSLLPKAEWPLTLNTSSKRVAKGSTTSSAYHVRACEGVGGRVFER